MLVDWLDELGLIDPGGRGDQVNREGPADDGRHFGQSPGVGGQLTESRAQHRPHRRREHRLTCIGGDPGPKCFDDEERIALGLAPEPGRQVRVEGVLGS